MIKIRNILFMDPGRWSRNFLLRDLSLNIQEGEFVSIMAFGSGKTTLLK